MICLHEFQLLVFGCSRHLESIELELKCAIVPIVVLLLVQADWRLVPRAAEEVLHCCTVNILPRRVEFFLYNCTISVPFLQLLGEFLRLWVYLWRKSRLLWLSFGQGLLLCQDALGHWPDLRLLWLWIFHNQR